MSYPYGQDPNQGYGQQNYGSPAPSYGGGYQNPPPQNYAQPDYSQQQYGAPAPYGSSAPYGSPAPQQPGYYDPNVQAGQYGPPATGGFQHGQAPPQGYNPDPYSQPQAYGQEGQRDAYGQPLTHYNSAPQNQYPQQGPYGSAPSYQGQNPNYDPNAPGGAQEGERGLLGAIGGGLAGHYGGKKMGHGLVGTLAGAFAGSKLEDAFKDRNKNKHGSSQYGGKW